MFAAFSWFSHSLAQLSKVVLIKFVMNVGGTIVFFIFFLASWRLGG